MGSCTRRTKARRSIRKAAVGKRRKALVRRTGTTPELYELNRPTEWELKSKQK